MELEPAPLAAFSILRLDNSNLYLCKFKWKFYERTFCTLRQTDCVGSSDANGILGKNI